MSTGLYTHTTRATGTVLTASIYNADHINHITNQNPSQTGAFSDNVAQMQSTTTPGGVGSESLATSLAGELQRIRFQLNAIIGGAQWYSAPATTLQSLAGAGVSDNSITNAKLADMAQALIKARDAGGGTGDPQDLTLTQVLDFVGSAANGDMLFRTGGVWSRLAIGSSTNVLTVSGGVPTWAAPTAGVKAADRQAFTSSGTWTKPSGFGAKAFAVIQCWGGGGGGGRSGSGAGQCGAGGGGGGYNERLVLLSALGATESVTIGAGGNAGAANNNVGSAGGNTTFGSWLTGWGGGGGGYGTVSAGGGCPPAPANVVNGGEGGLSTLAGITGPAAGSAAGTDGFSTISFKNSAAVKMVMVGPTLGGVGTFHQAGASGDYAGADSVWGGGGGGGKSNVTAIGAGTSVVVGNGGTSGNAGTAPSGGGGGNANAAAGAGAAGQCVVTVVDGA